MRNGHMILVMLRFRSHFCVQGPELGTAHMKNLLFPLFLIFKTVWGCEIARRPRTGQITFLRMKAFLGGAVCLDFGGVLGSAERLGQSWGRNPRNLVALAGRLGPKLRAKSSNLKTYSLLASEVWSLDVPIWKTVLFSMFLIFKTVWGRSEAQIRLITINGWRQTRFFGATFFVRFWGSLGSAGRLRSGWGRNPRNLVAFGLRGPEPEPAHMKNCSFIIV